LGRGEPLFEGMDWRELGYVCTEMAAGQRATHLILSRRT
jgi:hypothetical protein